MADQEFKLEEKVREYEQFINERLRKDLLKVGEQRDKVYEQISEYLKLKNVIERIQAEKVPSLKTQVDLGCHFYCQANVPDASKIFVAIGFGFFLELTLDEAVEFIDEKVEQLSSSVQKLTKDAAKIKAHIKLSLEGLREIQSLDFSPKEERTVYW